MSPSLGVVVQAILLVGAVVWCREVLGRLPRDVEEVRSAPSWQERVPVIAIWAVTAALSVWAVGTVSWVVRRLAQGAAAL